MILQTVSSLSMHTGYGWEGLRQVCASATLLGARHVPERLCGGLVYLGCYNKCSPLPFLPLTCLHESLSHTQQHFAISELSRSLLTPNALCYRPLPIIMDS